MTERNVGRPWTAHEDRLLTEAVHHYGENDNWKAIAVTVPGRTNKACRKRWLHSLSPSVKKTAWTPDEDQRLLQLYAGYGPKWSAIARQIPGRTDDACSKRYREALDPSLKKDEWTREEDEKLMEVYAILGGKWGQVGQELKRSGLGCRNRWRLLERKKASAVVKDTPSPPPAVHSSAMDLSASEEPPLQSNEWVPEGLGQVYWTQVFDDGSTIASPDVPSDSLILHVSPPMLAHDIDIDICSIASQPVPPFQFTSSSLSAALSTHRVTQPLPPIELNATTAPASPTENNHYSDSLMFDTQIIEPTPPTPPRNYSSLAGGISSSSSIEVLADACHDQRNSELEGALFEPTRTHEPVFNTTHADSTDESSNTLCSQEHLPSRFRSTAANDYFRSQYFASNSSSPIGLAGLTLSPTSSPPNAALPINLPNTRHTAISDSALFTPYYRSSAQPKPKPVTKRKPDTGTHRLSSNLPVTSE
jgi:hypothetical protein